MYKFYNANPKGLFTDDCVLRSISVAEGISWHKCQEKLSILSNKEGKLLNDVLFVEQYLDERYPRKCYKNMTVGEFSKKCPKGHFVVTMDGHITAVINGDVIDSFDPSDRVMRCAWYIE